MSFPTNVSVQLFSKCVFLCFSIFCGHSLAHISEHPNTHPSHTDTFEKEWENYVLSGNNPISNKPHLERLQRSDSEYEMLADFLRHSLTAANVKERYEIIAIHKFANDIK